MRIGVAGIGKMGAAIAARLIEVGHEVAVWNRTPDKARAIAGATVAGTPAELLQRADVIISSLTDAAALDAVYKGPSGLLSGDVAGKLFIDMSTVLPATEAALAEAARPDRRGKASSSDLSAATPPMSHGHVPFSSNCAAGSNMPGRPARARCSNSRSICR
jgi:3-hydroxyisobutyrate dehydrogenase-like beta-hydroxyacid dehydrogenase